MLPLDAEATFRLLLTDGSDRGKGDGFFFALLLLASHPGHAKAHRSEMWNIGKMNNGTAGACYYCRGVDVSPGVTP